MFLPQPDLRTVQPLLPAPANAQDANAHSDRGGRPPSYSGPQRAASPVSSTELETPRSRPQTPRDATAHDAARPNLSRHSNIRSRSPAEKVAGVAREAARTRYMLATFFLVVCLVSFTVQTELSAYVQRDGGWDKAYCMMYLGHGSWVILWPLELVVLRLLNRDVPWAVFWRRHVCLLRTTVLMILRDHEPLHTGPPRKAHGLAATVRYLVCTTALVTCSLTVAGLSWYVAVNKTTASDLTAIYNCSAFFAYAFSVPLLGEPLRLDKSIAVGVAILGVLVVAYGDSRSTTRSDDLSAHTRLLGNVIIGMGSILYGLYEVLYKRYACPPESTSPGRGAIFANFFGSLIGAFTLLVLWVPLPILHFTGLETFSLPEARTAWLLLLSVFMNAIFAGAFLVLISLTSPVLSSVAALLTIFLVGVADWMATGEAVSGAAIMGFLLIVGAFLVLSWSTFKEMSQAEKRKIEGDETADGMLDPEEDEEEFRVREEGCDEEERLTGRGTNGYAVG